MSKIILDIESKNHLKKDCGGDVSKLKIGLVGVKIFGQDKFLFFDEKNLDKLGELLDSADEIIGFNLVGHNGLDYAMLENYGIFTEDMIYKTFDLMTSMIRAFGSYEGMSLDNIAEHTWGIKKKKSKKANYKLLQSGQLDKVKENLKQELRIIEKLYLAVETNESVRFKTPWGLVDEHILPPLGGFYPESGEEVIQPYDFPVAGMRLQIKEKSEEVIKCSKCKKNWKVESICYYGDTMSEEEYCPNCGAFLTKVRSSLLGPLPQISEVVN